MPFSKNMLMSKQPSTMRPRKRSSRNTNNKERGKSTSQRIRICAKANLKKARIISSALIMKTLILQLTKLNNNMALASTKIIDQDSKTTRKRLSKRRRLTMRSCRLQPH